MEQTGVGVTKGSDVRMDVASIMKFIYELNKGTKYETHMYLKEAPEGFKKPAVYLPTPYEQDFNHTVSAYKLESFIVAKVIADDTIQAFNLASQIANEIRKKRYRIPLYNTDGKESGLIRFNRRLEIKQIDYGTYQITLTWLTIVPFDKEVYPMIRNFNLKSFLK